MVNILILGCGKIGSRHVQSLSKSKFALNIFIIDPSSQSVSATKNIFYSTVNNRSKIKLFVVTDISDINVNIEYLIIASNSKERSKLLSNSLNYLNPKNIILEKFLFSKISDYNKFTRIFDNMKTNVWVNEYMGYEFNFIKKYFESEKNIKVQVIGNWGLCCNAVHFIEIFHNLISRKKIYIHNCDFNNELKKSKRYGYYELYGKIELVSESSDLLTMKCYPELKEEIIKISLTSSNSELECIWENENIKYKLHENGNLVVSDNHRVRRQSERTLELIEDLLKENKCNLPKYEIAKDHHLLVIEEFKKKFIELGLDIEEEVPVT